MNFKPANCPNCGGSLQVPEDRTTINCMYCGSTVIVREAIHAAAVGNISNWLKLARAAAQAGNHAEAYDYFTRVLEVDSNNAEAWFGKGTAAGWMSTPQNFRLPETLNGFKNAIENSGPKNREAQSRAAHSINTICAAYYQNLRRHYGPSPRARERVE